MHHRRSRLLGAQGKADPHPVSIPQALRHSETTNNVPQTYLRGTVAADHQAVTAGGGGFLSYMGVDGHEFRAMSQQRDCGSHIEFSRLGIELTIEGFEKHEIGRGIH